MSRMPMVAPAMTALMTAAMMVAMMLPSVAPTLWRYHGHLRATRVPRAGQRATLFAVGYASVWTTISLALVAMSAELSPMGMASPADPPFARWAGPVVLCVGALQRSRWKAKQLLRCRPDCVTARPAARSVTTALREGCRLGVDCGLSCAAPMVGLLAMGLMDTRMMAVITAAITAERVAPGGARIARMTGALALAAGVVMCARARFIL
jgi:predicted metal-binding membrane protein